MHQQNCTNKACQLRLCLYNLLQYGNVQFVSWLFIATGILASFLAGLRNHGCGCGGPSTRKEWKVNKSMRSSKLYLPFIHSTVCFWLSGRRLNIARCMRIQELMEALIPTWFNMQERPCHLFSSSDPVIALMNSEILPHSSIFFLQATKTIEARMTSWDSSYMALVWTTEKWLAWNYQLG
jgi:hypothetical protein